MSTGGDRRRADTGVRWDPVAGELRVGGRSVALAGLDDNEAVLRSYLDLVLAQRGARLGQRISLRDDDIEALAQMLDLGDADLEGRLVRLLGVSTDEARRLRDRLRRRALRSVAALGVGALALIPSAQVSGGSPSAPAASSRPAARPAAAASWTPAPGPAPEETPTRTATGTGTGTDTSTAPAAAAPPAPSDPPAEGGDDTEIGDAVWYEQQADGGVLKYTESAPVPPADDGTDIGSALTIERIPPDSGSGPPPGG